jgi:DNA uptake protein ComE-like DNA-binding protein
MALTVLTVLAVALSMTARLELRQARRAVDAVGREAALRGAVNRGIALLDTGRTDPATLLSTLRSHRELKWEALAPETGADTSTEPGAPASGPRLQIALQLLDASARLNLNTADTDALSKLPGMPKDTPAALTAWRNDKDTSKEPAYSEAPRPYEPKRRPFDSLEELLLVKDVDPAQFFGSPSVAETRRLEAPPLSELLAPLTGENNTLPDGTARADVNHATAAQLMTAAKAMKADIQQAQIDSFVRDRDDNHQTVQTVSEVLRTLSQVQVPATGRAGSSVGAAQQGGGGSGRGGAPQSQPADSGQELWGKLLDAWTTDQRTFLPGRVNVNTAPALVLQAVPGMTDDIAGKILQQRAEKPEGLSWADLLLMVGQQGASQIEKVLCVRSAVYLVRCLVREEGSQKIEAAVAVVYWPASPDDPAKVVQWRRAERFPGWTAWYRVPGESEGSKGSTSGKPASG